MKKFLTILFILFNSNLYSANLYSIGTGNWNDPARWSTTSGGVTCNCAPNVGVDIIHVETDITLTSSIIISNSLSISGNLHTLTYDVEIKSGSTLEVSGRLEVNNLKFFNGSVVNVLPGAVIIVHGNLTNNNNSDDVEINGTVTVTGTFYNGNGGAVIGDGGITAGTFTGSGTSFGTTNNTIPPGSTVTTSGLPLELIEFTTICNENSRTIQWSTASESSTDYFIIRSSEDGTMFSGALGTIPAAGNSSTLRNYSFIDNSIYYDHTIYYELTEYDVSGYTKILGIRSSTCDFTSDIIEIYPNPVNEGEPLFIISDDGIKSIQVTDLLGRDAICTFENGNVKGLSSGVYLMIVDGVKKFKIIVK